ncbi:Cerato-platanin [Pisolithus croceorrhizus]|nr:Cerato-platanin [Pisolithus croceorrhizus]
MMLYPYLIFAFSLSVPVLAQMTTSLAYDAIYGDANLPLSRLACSDGSNGLESKGYTTLSSFSNFPYLGGAPTVADWNDPSCGKCYAVTYGKNTIKVIALDVSKDGFTVSPQVMDTLTDGQANALGRVEVTAAEVPASECSL